MSEKRLFNAIRKIALLQLLNTTEFITSKKIRNHFPQEFKISFYDRIETFHNLGWIEILEKEGDFAGDDRREYKLTQKGAQVREKLLKEIITLLEPVIAQIVQKKVASIEEPIVKNKEEQIENFLLEFSGESEGIVNDETLAELQKILKRLLSKML